MSDTVKQTIERLNDREVRQVATALGGRLRSKVREQYKSSPETLTELEERRNAPAILAAAGGPELSPGDLTSAEALRQMLIVLVDEPEFRDEVRYALDHRLTASIGGLDILAVSALVVFILSVKFEVDVKKTKSGQWSVQFKAAKKATPASLLKSLLAPLSGSGAKDG